MLDRNRLASTLWLISCPMLLVLAPDAPIRTPGPATAPPRAGCLRLSPDPPSSPPEIHDDAAKASDAAPRASAMLLDDGEEDRADAPHEPRVAFLIPRRFRQVLDHRSIARRSIPSHYPLRC